jgi:hypothetical protein
VGIFYSLVTEHQQPAADKSPGLCFSFLSHVNKQALVGFIMGQAHLSLINQ